MKQRRLGRTGLSVSELGLGHSFVAANGKGTVIEAVHRAIDLGINYFDVAPYYSDGVDEQYLGEALVGRRDRAVVATKVGYSHDPAHHRSAASLMAQLDQSLRSLRTDHVDVIQLHEADFRRWWSPDPITPEEAWNGQAEIIRDAETYDFAGAPVAEFLHRARQSGKARFVGVTGKDPRQLARVIHALDVDTAMIAHQFNPVMRAGSALLFPATTERDVGVLVAAVLMRGALAAPKHKWRSDAPPSWMDPTFHRAYFAYVDVAEREGLPMAELTLRWVLSEPRLSSVVVGFKTAQDVEANVRAASLPPLPAPLRKEIEALGIVHPLIAQGRTTL